jgi:two-component system response regulator HydG
MGSVLVVDDDKDLCELLVTELSERGWEASHSTSSAAALDHLQSHPEVDVVLTDLRLPGVDGLELCRQIVDRRPDVPVVVMTAFGSFENAVSAIRAGAYDFVTKPVEAELVQIALERALGHRRLVARLRTLSEGLEEVPRFDELVGESPPMRRLFDQCARLSGSDVPVLIVGESGSGKELVARALHARGPRSAGPFVPVNCSALPEALAESELFGHVKGAFTDARSDRKGLFEEAHGGTLFLDEIGEIPLALQPKLLRALEAAEVRPVGSNERRPIDVRLVCATNRDLEAAVEEGRFRDDLYFRINVVEVEVPPLRVRGHDVLLLAKIFLERAAKRQGKAVVGFSRAVADRLLAWRWPGNVRELRNCMEHAVALARFEQVGVDDLPERIRVSPAPDAVVAPEDPASIVPLEVIENRYILRALEAFGGNRTSTARALGLDRKTLQRKLARQARPRGAPESETPRDGD